MNRSKYGNEIVEFAFVGPLLGFVAIAFCDVARLASRQFALERACAAVVRRAATQNWSAETTEKELSARLKSPVRTALAVTPMPLSKPLSPWRLTKGVDVVELSAEQRIRPYFPLFRKILPSGDFTLRAVAKSVRLR